jgi:hypothetical protein
MENPFLGYGAEACKDGFQIRVASSETLCLCHYPFCSLTHPAPDFLRGAEQPLKIGI